MSVCLGRCGSSWCGGHDEGEDGGELVEVVHFGFGGLYVRESFGSIEVLGRLIYSEFEVMI